MASVCGRLKPIAIFSRTGKESLDGGFLRLTLRVLISCKLRAWQRFVCENIEIRLVTAPWSREHGLKVPVIHWACLLSIAGEILRDCHGWAFGRLSYCDGTLDPFVAFALSRDLAKTRAAAAAGRGEFVGWLEAEYDDLNAEDFIDPQPFLAWECRLTQPERAARLGTKVPAELV